MNGFDEKGGIIFAADFAVSADDELSLTKREYGSN